MRYLHAGIKHRYLLAGCNGAGKTTAAYALLPGRSSLL
jgi:predicted ATPase